MDEKDWLRYLEMKEQREQERREFDKEIQNFKRQESDYWYQEANRIYSVMENKDMILNELSECFRRDTSISSKEMKFVFFAVALQSCRWFFQPKINPEFSPTPKIERHDAGVDGSLEAKKRIEKANKNKNAKIGRYPDKSRIFLEAVPYDVMNGTEDIVIPYVTGMGNNINGRNHHAVTLGHDPILGYIFGTINIMTKTVTFKNLELTTKRVYLVPGSVASQYAKERINFFPFVLEETVESAQEDITRIPAAIVRQTIHMQSDKFTKQGLPIPFISPAKAQALLNKGWNSYELERFSKLVLKNSATVGVQAVLVSLINVIIEILRELLYDPKIDGREDIYQAKTKKIIVYSNMIANTSNVIYSAISKDISKLDFGGFIITIHRIVSDNRFIKKIREEYVYGGFEKMLELEEIEF